MTTYICKQEAAVMTKSLWMMEPAQANSPMMWMLTMKGNLFTCVLMPPYNRLVFNISNSVIVGPPTKIERKQNR